MKEQEVIVHKKARRPIKNQDCENQTSFSVHDGPADSSAQQMENTGMKFKGNVYFLYTVIQ